MHAPMLHEEGPAADHRVSGIGGAAAQGFADGHAVAYLQLRQRGRAGAMAADNDTAGSNCHVARRGHGGHPVIDNFHLATPLIGFGGGCKKAVVEHQIISNTHAIHALQH